MAGSVKVNGVWKSASDYYVKVNGVWKNVINGYVKINGVWKLFYAPAAPAYYAAPVYYASPTYYTSSGGGGCIYYTVTNLSGLTTSQATNSITGSGNNVGSASPQSTTNSSLNGQVVSGSQSPAAGLYCGQQTVSFSYYQYTAPTGGGCGACGDGGVTSTTESYCNGEEGWARSVTTYRDACNAVCNTTYGAGYYVTACGYGCGCGSVSYYAAPTYYNIPVVTYYAAPIYYNFNSTYYAAPIYYTITNYFPSYYAAPIYYNFNSTYYAAPIYYVPNTSVTYYAAPIYYTYYAPTYYAYYAPSYYAAPIYYTYYAPTYYAAPVYYRAPTYYAAPVYYTRTGGGCWAYGTQVRLANGLVKPIEDLKVGDVVKSPIIPTYPNGEDYTQWYPGSVWSIENPGIISYETTTVRNVKHWVESSFYLLNDTYKLTGDHFLFVKKDSKWQFAKTEEILVGDFVKDEFGQSIEIFKKNQINEFTMVVDIDVEENDLFLANGIITHNVKA